jgi:hypothetical protein
MKPIIKKSLIGVVFGIICLAMGLGGLAVILYAAFAGFPQTIITVLGVILAGSVISGIFAYTFSRIWYLGALLFGIPLFAIAMSLGIPNSNVKRPVPWRTLGAVSLVLPLAVAYYANHLMRRHPRLR